MSLEVAVDLLEGIVLVKPAVMSAAAIGLERGMNVQDLEEVFAGARDVDQGLGVVAVYVRLHLFCNALSNLSKSQPGVRMSILVLDQTYYRSHCTLFAVS